MTENKFKRKQLDLKALFSKENDGLKDILREVVQEVLEQEMTDTIWRGQE